MSGMLKGFEKIFTTLKQAREETTPWTLGFSTYWSGDDIGAYYTSLGRGGKVILNPIYNAMPAIDYTPIVQVQSIPLGVYLTGSYNGNPLAQTANPNATQPIASI
jgi:hypothetical protein